jgi:hypothetical protein
VHPDSLCSLDGDIFTFLGDAGHWTYWFLLEMHSVTDLEFAGTTTWYSHMGIGERIQWLAISPTSVVNLLFLHTQNLLSHWEILGMSTSHLNPVTLLSDASAIADGELSLTAISDPNIVIFETKAVEEGTLLL